MAQYFKFELTPVRASLFKDNMMRKPDKAVLGRLLSTNACVDVPGNCGTHYVLDSGALLHRVRWMKGLTYSQIAKQCVTYIARHYGTCVTIVFDGYSSGQSTKDHEHLRCSTKTAATANIDFDCLACSDQQSFLANRRLSIIMLYHASGRNRDKRHQSFIANLTTVQNYKALSCPKRPCDCYDRAM